MVIYRCVEYGFAGIIECDAGVPVVDDAAEIVILAERKLGEMLAGMAKHPPGPPKEDRSHDVTDPSTLADLGIEKMQSSRWQTAATVPEDELAKHFEETRAGIRRRRSRTHARQGSQGAHEGGRGRQEVRQSQRKIG